MSTARLAAVIDAFVREHRAVTPPLRGLACLGLEPASGTGFHLLDTLAARGIFRKYELVLDLGAGLGGAARWLAARLGCEVVATAGDAAEAAAADHLTRGARLGAQIRHVAARADALPVRDARFTHVWIVEALPRLPDPPRALAAAYHALRRGGTLALQDLVAPHGAAPVVPGWTAVDVDARVAMLRAAGFADVEVRDRTADAGERSPQVVAAREQLLRRLRADATLAPFAAERDALSRALAARELGVVQILARRP